MLGLPIGKVAKLLGISTQTIRYYEREGVIPEPPRLYSGFRYFHEEAITQLRFVTHLKSLGFSMKEIKKIVQLSEDLDTTGEMIKTLISSKIQDINKDISHAHKTRQLLEDLSRACPEGQADVRALVLELFD